jgi:hypothetical protein
MLNRKASDRARLLTRNFCSKRSTNMPPEPPFREPCVDDRGQAASGKDVDQLRPSPRKQPAGDSDQALAQPVLVVRKPFLLVMRPGTVGHA